MLRTILAFLFLFLFFMIGLPIQLILFLLNKTKPGIMDRASQSLVQFAFHVIIFISGAKITVKGKENLPKNQAVLFVGNHSSYFDIPISYVNIPFQTGYIAKKEMEKIPCLSTWMKNIKCLFLDRENVKEGLKTILAGVEQIKAGGSVFIFPEGTRSKNGVMLPFKEGSTKMAEKAKCPIIPVAFTNTADLFENNRFHAMKPRHTTIEFGAPIYIDQLEKDQRKFLGAYIQKLIQDMLAE